MEFETDTHLEYSYLPEHPMEYCANNVHDLIVSTGYVAICERGSGVSNMVAGREYVIQTIVGSMVGYGRGPPAQALLSSS